jgi:hypothetical protein
MPSISRIVAQQKAGSGQPGGEGGGLERLDVGPQRPARPSGGHGPDVRLEHRPLDQEGRGGQLPDRVRFL